MGNREIPELSGSVSTVILLPHGSSHQATLVLWTAAFRASQACLRARQHKEVRDPRGSNLNLENVSLLFTLNGQMDPQNHGLGTLPVYM